VFEIFGAKGETGEYSSEGKRKMIEPSQIFNRPFMHQDWLSQFFLQALVGADATTIPETHGCETSWVTVL
jgi:hypothetical protein